MMIKKIFLFINLSFFMSCGLPDASSFQELQPPYLSGAECTVTGGNNVSINLKFMSYNNETGFSGYNVYITSQTSSIDEVYNVLSAQASEHISSQSDNLSIFNTEVEDNFIVQSQQKTFPTIPASSLSGFDKAPSENTSVITNNPKEVFNRAKFTTNTRYGIALTSISLANIKESVLSNVIIVDTDMSTNQCTVTL